MCALSYSQPHTSQHPVQAFGGPYFLFKHDLSQKRPQEMSLESWTKYRDAAVWRVLCREEQVDIENLLSFWELLDQMMDISIESASLLLQNLYEYRIRKLSVHERQRLYPDVTNELFRLEYDDGCGGYRDVCAGTLLCEAIDLLQAEAERLIRR